MSPEITITSEELRERVEDRLDRWIPDDVWNRAEPYARHKNEVNRQRHPEIDYYWAEAGRMLGASSEADYEPISSGSGTAVVYDLSGLSFSPQIKVEGDTDEDALIRKLRDLEPEFIDFILEALSRREGGAYVTADSRLY